MRLDLQDATAVHFGSALASFTMKPAITVVAVAPTGSGTAHVTVTAPVGTSAKTKADKYTY